MGKYNVAFNAFADYLKSELFKHGFEVFRKSWDFLKPFKLKLCSLLVINTFVVIFDLLSLAVISALVLSFGDGAVINLPLFGEIENPVSGFEGNNGLIASLLVIILMQVLRESFLFWSEFSLKSAEIELDYTIREELFSALSAMKYDVFSDQKHTDMILYGTNFVRNYSGFILDAVRLVVVFIVIGLYSFASLAVDPQAFIFVATVVMFLVFLTSRMVSIQRVFGLELRDLERRHHSLLHDVVGGHKEISLNDARGFFVCSAITVLEQIKHVRLRAALLTSSINPIQRGLALAICGMAVVGLVLASNDATPVGRFQELLVVIFLLLRMYGPVSQSNALRSSLMVRVEPTVLVLDFLSMSKRNVASGVPASVGSSEQNGEGLKGDIDFGDVQYSYPSNSGVALKGVNCRIPHKQITAIVGPTGAGKSTIVDLLTTLRVPTGGEISVNGVALADAHFSVWTRQVSVIHQNGYIFTGSIADNISMFDEAVPMGDIEKAVDRANLRELVDGFERGVLTEIGGTNAPLSGGQRQRIQIARALVRKPSLLILDEATSAQDSLNEVELLKEIRQEFKDSTIVTVAHRFSAIREANHILVLNHGELVQSGSWAELSKQDGLFLDLLTAQSLSVNAENLG